MVMTMEEILTMMMREAGGPRNATIRKTCREALEMLKFEDASGAAEPYQLRESCLVPLQFAIESRSVRLAQHAIAGIHRILVEEQFQTCMESEDETKWLPIQILNAVWWTPNLPDELQVEVMKIVFKMTFSTPWSMNAKVITKIAELSFSTFLATTKPNLRSFIANALAHILRFFHHRDGLSEPGKESSLVQKLSSDISGTSSQASVRTAVKATLTQLLSTVTERLREKHELGERDADDAIAEFTSNAAAEANSLSHDVVEILRFLCNKLRIATAPGGTHHPEPLLLEGIYSILRNLHAAICTDSDFIDLIWQDLCPNLVVLLGNPLQDKSITSQKVGSQEEMGRGSGCSGSAPNVTVSCAKTIYNIAIELVRLVGSIRFMRPVLESVFHRMLLYPPPVHRYDALKVVKEALSSPGRLMELAGPTLSEHMTEQTFTNTKRRRYQDIALLKIVIDAAQECCHCSDMAVCITSVDLVNDLLTSVEKLVRGEGLSEQMIAEIHRQYREVESTYHGMTYVSTVLVPESVFTDEQTERTTVVKYTDMVSSDSETDSDSDYGPQDSDGDFDSQNEKERTSCTAMESQTGGPREGSWRKTYPQEEKLVPKLHDAQEVGVKYTLKDGVRDYEAIERHSAQEYLQQLEDFMPRLLEVCSTTKVDAMMLQFASDICTELCAHPSEGEDVRCAAILNADGVYMATYSTLLLNLKLIRCGYYISDEKSLPISQEQFVDDILGCGLLLYLSSSWLQEVYRHVIQTDYLTKAGYRDTLDDTDSALVQVLTDIDGLGSRKIGGQLLCGYRDCCAPGDSAPSGNPVAAIAGMKFARRIVAACWEGMLDVLSVLLNGKSSLGITSSIALLLGGKEEGRRVREAICTSLDGLQRAARLSCVLGVQDRCGGVFAELAGASCVLEELRREERRHAVKASAGVLPATRGRLARLHSAQALSMDVVLSIGLEMGSHAADCWKHVFRCCAQVSELEHTVFSCGQNQANLPKVQQEQQHLDLTSDPYSIVDGELYVPIVVSSEPVAPSINVAEFIRESSEESGWDAANMKSEVLPLSHAAKVLCGLSQEVDRLFEDAAIKLNMKALVSFLAELCRSSKYQLAAYGGATTRLEMPTNALHLYRLGDILMRCLSSGRPLVHLMSAWSVVAPYLVEAACHRDHNISKKAVDCIHEFGTTLLSQWQELPHFHFNESLCKPFENLLCLELCDGDVQDQVVCSICELVEGCTSEIKSGWRPLFGALRAVKIEYTTVEEVNEARQRHIAAVLDVFNVFLNTDNVMVFANAAVDCILCLLKYVKGPAVFEETGGDDDTSDSGSELDSGQGTEELCLPALRYLEQCCAILASMWKMPACPIFNGAHRIQMAVPKCVDPVIPNMDLNAFQKPWVDEDDRNHPIASAAASPATVDRTDQTDDRTNGDSTSLDSGIGVTNQEGTAPSPYTSPVKEEEKHETSHDEREDQSNDTSEDKSLEEIRPGEPEVAQSMPGLEPSQKDSKDTLTKDSEDLPQKDAEDLPQKVVEEPPQKKIVEDSQKIVDEPLQKEIVEDSQKVAEEPPQNKVLEDSQKVADLPPQKEIVGDTPRNVTEDSPQKATEDPSQKLVAASQKDAEDPPQKVVEDFPQKVPKDSPEKAADEPVDKNVPFALVSLEDLDNTTGVLHVWFLVLEGLATTVATAPKHYQPQTLEMLFTLLRSASQVPGPDFALHCVNHLLLPMMQSWLRRGNQITGFWETSAAHFKQCCGLCTDLVVEFIIQFAGVVEQQAAVGFMLKQLLCVLIECVAQSNEALSRLGCACIRHCLQSTGPLLPESMWHIATRAISHAFNVTLYCLHLLMTPFHADSDNFYGDIGHVKVAVRKDCSGIECERLRQLAQQVFLLDSQRGTSMVIDYEMEENRSYIFLIHPPNHEKSNNPELSITRVPFRSIVVGLLSHQILVQMVGALLLQGSSRMVPAERHMIASMLESERAPEPESEDLLQDIPLPGMLRYLSTRNTMMLLQCLRGSYQAAAEFDARPGLKFLMQKVSRASVAANLYKQAGISLTLYIHTLIEITAHQDNADVSHVQRVLAQATPDTAPTSAQSKTIYGPQKKSTWTELDNAAASSTGPVQHHMTTIIHNLKVIFDEVCLTYVDLYLDREGPSKTDQLSNQMLVFLLAEPEELPQLKREKSINQMVAEKLRKEKVARAVEQHAVLAGPVTMPAVTVQGNDEEADVDTNEAAEDWEVIGPAPLEPQKSGATDSGSPPSSPEMDRSKRPAEDKVYTVATDRTIKNLMTEYKKRKQVHSMPTFIKANRSRPAPPKKEKSLSKDPFDLQIEEQHRTSIMKDSEAHLASWIEMLVSVLSLFHQLPDLQYRALLPTIFTCVNQLVCHCKDSRLREALAQWVHRIGHLYGMAPLDNAIPLSR